MLMFCFYISDPPMVVNYKTIGKKISYNQINYDPLDGFIKNKDECYILLPSIHKRNITGE